MESAQSFTGWGNTGGSPTNDVPDDHPRIMWPYQAEHWRDKWFNGIDDDEHPPTTYAGLAATLSMCYGSQLRLEDLSDFLMLYSRQEYAVSDIRMFGEIIPFIYDLIKSTTGLPCYVLLPGDNVKISRRGVASIIAMMLFGMFDYLHMDYQLSQDDVPRITMLELFKSQNMNAFASVIGYFDTMVESATKYTKEFDATILVYCRVAGADQTDDLSADATAMRMVEFAQLISSPREIKVCAISELPIDDAFDKITNHTLALYEHTELLAAGAFVPRLDAGESIIVYGADKFNDFNGRQYTGPSDCHYDYGDGSVLMAKIAVILTPPSSAGTTRRLAHEFLPDFQRLRVAFKSVRPMGSPITISSYMIPWTTGVGGNVYSTFIQSWMAASLAGRTLIFPAADCNLRETAARFIVWSRRSARTVGALWSHWCMTIDRLLNGKKPLSEVNLFSAMESYRSERTGGVRFRDEKPEYPRKTQKSGNRQSSRPMDDYSMVRPGSVRIPTRYSQENKLTTRIPSKLPINNPFDGY